MNHVPLHTFLGFDTVTLDYSIVWPHLGDLYLIPARMMLDIGS